MKLSPCPVCKEQRARSWDYLGGKVICYCGFQCPSTKEWNRLARLAEIGRLVESMESIDFVALHYTEHPDGKNWFVKHEARLVSDAKTPLAALQKAARSGKWKVKR